MTSEAIVRREIRSRSSWWAPRTARWLKERGVTPNQVSIASMFFGAAAGGAAILGAQQTTTAAIAGTTVLALAMILGRLLCNLFDGMIAVEGGLKTKSGEVFNEVPDRLSDTFVLVGVGYAITSVSWAPTLGWIGACAALFTAYARVLGGALGLKQHFSGPMAKQHRMAVTCAGLALGAVERIVLHTDRVLLVALLVIAAGSLVTTARRLARVVAELEARDP